jgi:signal recognition particle subunit SRP54
MPTPEQIEEAAAKLPGLGGAGGPGGLKLPGLGGLPPGFNPFKK